MKKGNYGICLWFYAVLAFILAFLGQTLLCGLLLGFVIIAEKDEWLTKQIIQAFFLTITSSLVSGVLNMLNVFDGIPIVGAIFNTIIGIITSIVSLVVLIFVIIGIVKTAKGNDAGIPGFSGLANKAFGYVAKKVYTNVNSNDNTNESKN